MKPRKSKITERELGDRLKRARLDTGLTQADVASRIGIARPTLVAIEKGDRIAQPGVLRQLAAIYQVPVNRLRQPEIVKPEFSARYRRSAKSSQSTNAWDVVALLKRFATTAVEIEQALEVSFDQGVPATGGLGTGNINELARDAALSLRQRLGVGITPISDLIPLLEIELGFRIFMVRLPGEISGAYAYDPAVGPCMLVNLNHPHTRQNYTIAHELGHFIGSRDDVDVNIGPHIIDSREERFANTFAAAFLMPPPWLRRRFQEIKGEAGRFSPRNLVFLARAAHVSPEALCRWLENLGLVKQGTWESLKERGFNTNFINTLGLEDAQAVALPPPRLAWLAANAVAQGLLSEGQLVERLGIDRSQVRYLLDDAMVSGVVDSEVTA